MIKPTSIEEKEALFAAAAEKKPQTFLRICEYYKIIIIYNKIINIYIIWKDWQLLFL